MPFSWMTDHNKLSNFQTAYLILFPLKTEPNFEGTTRHFASQLNPRIFLFGLLQKNNIATKYLVHSVDFQLQIFHTAPLFVLEHCHRLSAFKSRLVFQPVVVFPKRVEFHTHISIQRF
jgi:hypothetical protein